MNRLDRMISYFSPELGLKRAQARAAQDIMLAYDGAQRGYRTEHWRTDGGDANADFPTDLPALRNRCRDLCRNHPLAKRMKSVVVNSAIGKGIRDFAMTGSPEFDREIDEYLKQWYEDGCDSTGQDNWYGLQKLNAGAVFESGASLVRKRFRSNDPFPGLQLQTLEVDRIDMSQSSSSLNRGGGGVTIEGIDVNRLGRPTAYWLYPNHPGSRNVGMTDTVSRRVSAANVVHTFIKDRPEQVHGVPMASSVIMLLRDFDERNEAEIVTGKVAAALGLWVEQEGGIAGGTVGALSKTAEGRNLETLAPGMVHYGRPGEKPTLLQPPTHAGYGDFSRVQEELIAISVDMFYAQLTGNLSGVNYSSYRAGDRDFRGMVDAFRWLLFIPRYLKPLRRAAIDAGILTGALTPPAGVSNPYKVLWVPQPYTSINPLEDAKTRRMQLEDGTLLYDEAIAELSQVDPDEYIDAIEKRINDLRDRGLNFAWMEGNTPDEDATENSQNDEDTGSALSDFTRQRVG